MFKTQRLLRYFNPSLAFTRHYMYPQNFFQILRNEPQPQHTQLENGLNVVSLKQDGCKAFVGIFADAGSRYEMEFENGMAHMFEHIVFKGKTKWINDLGIKLHAFTTREIVGYYAYCQPELVKAAATILAQCFVKNEFNANEIGQEKQIVYQEIIKQDTNPKTIVFDYLHATAFQGTGLANTVLGTTKNLYQMDSAAFKRFWQRVFTPCRTCLCAVGCVDHEEIVKIADSELSWDMPTPCMERLYRYTGSDVRYRNDAMPLAHVAYALEGPPFADLDAITIDLAAILIGGWDKSQLGDERHGVSVARRASLGQFCDAYKSFNIKYQDTSLFGVQFIATSLQQEDMLFTIQDTLLDMSTALTEGEFERAKEQMKSSLLYKRTTSFGIAKDLAKHVLYDCCYFPPLNDKLCFIDRIALEDFMRTMYKYVYNKCPVISAVGPTEGLPDYNRINASQYWIRM